MPNRRSDSRPQRPSLALGLSRGVAALCTTTNPHFATAVFRTGTQQCRLQEHIMKIDTQSFPKVRLWAPLMPEIIADSPDPSCSILLSESGIQESQSLGLDPYSFRARETRGRFAKGSSGNPRGRPRGIRNPRRRIPDLVAQPLSAQALWRLLDRKPHLLLPFAEQLLPPSRASTDPIDRLGIDLASVRTGVDLRWMPGSLGLHEEYAAAAAAAIARFIDVSPAG